MGYPTKIQQITRKDFNQYYINFPMTIAMAMNFSKSNPVGLEIVDKDTLILKRKKITDAGQKELKQIIYYNINLDSLVSEDHFLKRLGKLISFNFVRDIKKSYCSYNENSPLIQWSW